ncbi:MAG: serine/threonine protein kinase [Myxococcales bacterium]|nr:serine/threonine protein kinase [Myxococcales bacterium]
MPGPTISPPLSDVDLDSAEVTDPLGRRTPFSLGRTSILPDLTLRDGSIRLRTSGAERFSTEATIGAGGNGLVARAVDADLGRRVAIKRLREQMKAPGDVARFVREVRLMGSLEHPNIVPVYDVGQGEDDAFYAVMKWVDGETLEDLLHRLRSGDDEAHATWTFDARTRLFLDVCRGISHANSRGVLHRDIKPGNVMVTSDGSVQILDWGLAKAIGEPDDPYQPKRPREAWQTQAGGLLGTPAYMAPEQARGEPYTHRTEVFALGALFWELLTLRSLWYQDMSTEDMVEFAKRRELPVPFHMRPNPAQGPVPSHLSWFVWRATRPDPMERFANVDHLMRELKSRAAGSFPVQCPATFQRRALMGATRLLDRYPKAFPAAVGTTSVLAILGAFLAGMLAS